MLFRSKAIFAQSNSTYWVVVNKVRYPSLTEPDKDGEKMEDMIALDAVIAADTIDELAAATGMDAAKLQESIDTYNAVVAGEKEDPFGFKANNSADVQLTEGPWYACKKVPTVHHTKMCIRDRSDDAARVEQQEERPAYDEQKADGGKVLRLSLIHISSCAARSCCCPIRWRIPA